MINKSLKIIFLNNEKAKLVLEHKYVGCFFTRCGCNSTLEASVNAWWQQHSGLINQQMLSISLMFCIIKGIHGRSEIRRNSYKIVFGNASAAAVNEKAILHLFG
jgi:hypothetical protein